MRITRANICQRIKHELGLAVELHKGAGFWYFSTPKTDTLDHAENNKVPLAHLSALSLEQWVGRFETIYENAKERQFAAVYDDTPTKPRAPGFYRLVKAAARKGLTLTDGSNLDEHRALIQAPHGQLLDGQHVLTLTQPATAKKGDLWRQVSDTLQHAAHHLAPCETPRCPDCNPTRKTKPAPELRVPDPSGYQGTTRYLRDLISASGLSIAQAADAIGIKLRTLQDYVSDRARSRHPYPIEFALECVVAARAVK